jgi:PEP-CTERM motif
MFQKRFFTVGFSIVLSGFGGQALAANVTVDKTLSTGEQYSLLSSSATLAFDSALINLLPTAGISFGGIAPAVYTPSNTSLGLTFTSFNYDNVTNKLTSFAAPGGAAFNMPTAKSILFVKVGGPGNVSFQDFQINLTNNTISAITSGGNGLSTGRLDVFSFTTQSDKTFAGAGTYNFKMDTLNLTTAGIDAVTKGLALTTAGKNTIASIGSLASAAATFQVAMATAPVPAVPEPSTYALMGLGLVAISLAAKRRMKA